MGSIRPTPGGADCAAGFYDASGGQASCTLAEAGSYVASDGATATTPCALGTYSGSGAAACDPCGAGKYAGEPGTSACGISDASKTQVGIRISKRCLLM